MSENIELKDYEELKERTFPEPEAADGYLSGARTKNRRPAVRGVSSVLRSTEREQSPQCGVATIEVAEDLPGTVR